MTSSSDSPPNIAELRQRFAQLERPAHSRSTRDVILHELMPEIEKKLSRGWRYSGIVAGLREVGISVSSSALRNYVTQARQDRGKSASSMLLKSAKNRPATDSKRAAKTVSPTVLPAAKQSMETSKPSFTRPRRSGKKTGFAGFDETP